MSKLRLFLLGPPRVDHNQQPVEIKRRKVWALLAYLAVTGEQQRRDTLATLLWPNSTQQQARKSLRRHLSELNQTLGGKWLETNRESVTLRQADELWVDSCEFQQKLAVCQTHNHSVAEVCPDCLPLLVEAVDLYRADFLTGFNLPDCPDFDEWQFFETETLRQNLSTALQRLIQLQQQGDTLTAEAAIVYARRWLTLDPLHEPAHRALMQFYAQADQQAAAIRQYEECVRILDEELGLAPEEETTTLHEAIKTKRLVSPLLSSEVQGQKASATNSPQATQDKVITNNLPTQPTPFIGRDKELAAIHQLLLDEPNCRLLTLVGPGGIGKTRLALAVAEQVSEGFPNGVYFVGLGSVSEPEFIVFAIAEALGVSFYGATDPTAQLLTYLGQKRLCLIVDNFEHLLDRVDLLSEMLSAAPQIKLLVTSRERLNLQEAWSYEVRGMTFPDLTTSPSIEAIDLEAYSAIQLFLQRARRAEASFTPSAEDIPHLIRICQLVDGTPLGLELAAPWTRILSCQEIAQEIERNLGFLRSDFRNVPERHRSLKAVFEQTWQQLSEAEQGVLSKLSVFQGGCTRDAAEAVADATLQVLSSLVDKALLRRAANHRYTLHELIRQFAAEQIRHDPKAHKQTQALHGGYYITWLQQRTPDLKTDRQSDVVDAMRVDIDNILTAWQRAVSQKDVSALGQAAESLWMYNFIWGSLGEAVFQQAVAALTTQPDQKIMVGQEALAGFLMVAQSVLANKPELMLQGLSVLRQANPPDRPKEAFVLMQLSAGLYSHGLYAEAQMAAQESLTLFSDLGDDSGQAGASLNLGMHARDMGNFTQAEHHFTYTLQLTQKTGDPSMMVVAKAHLAGIKLSYGQYQAATPFLTDSWRLSQNIKMQIASVFPLLERGRLAIIQGELDDAIDLMQQLLVLLDQMGRRVYGGLPLSNLGTAFRLQGNYTEAERYYEESLATSNDLNHPRYQAICYNGFGCLAFDQGGFDQAEQHHKTALAIWQKMGNEPEIAATLGHLGQVIVAADKARWTEAQKHFQQALTLSLKHNLAPVALDIFVRAATLFARMDDIRQALECLVFVEQHPASTYETKRNARQQWGTLSTDLSPEIVSAAKRKGETLDWREIAQNLIDTLANPAYNIPLTLSHNLPVQSIPFVGRKTALADLQTLLGNPTVRLITIVGPGGMGKTRLALAVADQQRHLPKVTRRFPDGTFFVPLVALQTAEQIIPAIVKALNLSLDHPTQEPDSLIDTHQQLTQDLLNYLRHKRLLLILDNFEQLLDNADQSRDLLIELVQSAPQITLLITSRERLQLREEYVYPLSGLDTSKPMTLDTVADSPAAQLFLQSAQRVQPQFAFSEDEVSALHTICQLVGGMPLGLELAAGWVDTLSLAEIAAEIQENLDFLETMLRNVEARHQTMRTVLDYAWQRLSPNEQTIFAQLSIFQGGFTREAAQTVTAASPQTLSTFVSKGLIQFQADQKRYDLHELLRQYSLEKLVQAVYLQ